MQQATASGDSHLMAILHSNRAAALLGIAEGQSAKLKDRADAGSVSHTHGEHSPAIHLFLICSRLPFLSMQCFVMRV